jgi:hypothetical protein
VTDPDTGRVYTFNTATMTDLEAGSTVFYRVGNPLDGWSSVYSFVATRTDFSDPAMPLRVGVFGDLGWQNAQALAYLETEAASGNFDFVVSGAGSQAVTDSQRVHVVTRYTPISICRC